MNYDVIVIGGGPAGYVAAIRSGQLGHKTLLLEKDKLGGMCLNWGCIPSKALLESAKKLVEVQRAEEFGVTGIDVDKVGFDWTKAASRAERLVKRLSKGVESLLKKNGVETEIGKAVLNSPNEVLVNNRLLTTRFVILATGSLPMPIEGDVFSVKDLYPFKELLKQKSLPKRPLILGDGPSAIEMAQFFSMVNAQPLLVTFSERLVSMADPYISEVIGRQLQKSRVMVKAFSDLAWNNAKRLVHHDNWNFEYDALINLADRQAVLPETKGFSLDLHQGFLQTNEHLQTSQKTIYAVGDVNGLSIFAHAASAQGLFAVNHLSGVQGLYPPKAIPLNLYTYPEIAQVGYGEHQLKKLGIEYKTADFPLSANGKAMAEGQVDGTVRIHYEPRYGEILGVIIVAPQATDMIAEAVSLIELEATVADVARMVHAHPTISEVMMEAAFIAIDAPIHR